ncbi:MAG: 4-(cytidine 5'-diphospho)-2-C-methyl-D-erythritol kinase [Acetobacteraceae bacterium]
MEREAARAKVNLFLHVLGRRPDGYHLLDSLAVCPGAADEVRAEPAEALTLAVEGPFAAGLADDNLVLRAARALAAAAGGRGARLVLDKRLPVASGIGGGSADAAATLRLLTRLWGVAVPPAALAAIALELGADVPVCLLAEPARMGGIGELLGVAPILPACGIVLVNPGVAVSTAEVFRARDSGFSEPAVLPPRWADAPAMATDLAALRNDLEAPALRLCPPVGEVLAWLRTQPGCLLARMSGSGATCFGLFAEEGAAQAVAARGPSAWWRWGGALG